MKLIKTSRLLHRWLMLFVGLQCIIWSVTGLYMVVFDIDYIHGDSLVINHQTAIGTAQVNYPLTELYQAYPTAENISLSQFDNSPIFRFNEQGRRRLISAVTGEILASISEPQAREIARHYYNGDSEINSVELITENPPFELRASALPAWRVNFNDYQSSSLYISAESGALVGKRHQFWRIFDWMFRFHVMDYDDGENFQNILLFLFALLGLCAAISGSVLTYVKVIKPFVNRKKRALTPRNKPTITIISSIKKQHQWLSLLVGIQIMIWLVTGVFFNLMDTEKSSGLTFYKKPETISSIDISQLVPLKQLLIESETLSNKPSVAVELIYLLDKPVFKITHHKGVYPHFYNDVSLLDAYTGRLVKVDEALAAKLALNTYSGTSEITNVRLISPPVDDFLKQQNTTWQINIDDPLQTAIYIEQASGRFIGHSNNDKRFSDLFLTLHFMDYGKSGGFNHWLIITTALFTLWFVYSGVLLISHAIKLKRYKF